MASVSRSAGRAPVSPDTSLRSCCTLARSSAASLAWRSPYVAVMNLRMGALMSTWSVFLQCTASSILLATIAAAAADCALQRARSGAPGPGPSCSCKAKL